MLKRNSLIFSIIICILFAFSNKKKHINNKLAIEYSLQYLEKEDLNFRDKLSDTAFIYYCNEDILGHETKGSFFFIGDRYAIEGDTIFFSELIPTFISKKEILQTFKKYNKDKIKFIYTNEEYYNTLERLSVEPLKKIPKKWIFTINGFRKNENYAVFQVQYRARKGGFLGCEFVYDYNKKELVEKICELPYKGK